MSPAFVSRSRRPVLATVPETGTRDCKKKKNIESLNDSWKGFGKRYRNHTPKSHLTPRSPVALGEWRLRYRRRERADKGDALSRWSCQSKNVAKALNMFCVKCERAWPLLFLDISQLTAAHHRQVSLPNRAQGGARMEGPEWRLMKEVAGVLAGAED